MRKFWLLLLTALVIVIGCGGHPVGPPPVLPQGALVGNVDVTEIQGTSQVSGTLTNYLFSNYTSDVGNLDVWDGVPFIVAHDAAQTDYREGVDFFGFIWIDETVTGDAVSTTANITAVVNYWDGPDEKTSLGSITYIEKYWGLKPALASGAAPRIYRAFDQLPPHVALQRQQLPTPEQLRGLLLEPN